MELLNTMNKISKFCKSHINVTRKELSKALYLFSDLIRCVSAKSNPRKRAEYKIKKKKHRQQFY